MATKRASLRPLCECTRARDQLLAGAAFAEDQHRHVGRRDLLDHAAHLEHRVVGGDEPFERRAHLRLAAAGGSAARARAAGTRGSTMQPQHVRIDRLLVEIVGAERHGAHRVVAIGVAGDDDDPRVRREAQDFLERAHAFADAFGIGRQARDPAAPPRGSKRRSCASASSRSPAISTSYSSKLQRSCFCSADVVFDDQQAGFPFASARAVRS